MHVTGYYETYYHNRCDRQRKILRTSIKDRLGQQYVSHLEKMGDFLVFYLSGVNYQPYYQGGGIPNIDVPASYHPQKQGRT